MSYYNQFKKIISYLNYIFGIYLWVLIIYAFLRWTGLIKRVFMQEHLLGEYLSLPIKFILSIFKSTYDPLLLYCYLSSFMLGCRIV